MQEEATGMAVAGVRPDVILASPKLRTRQTAEIVSDGLPGGVEIEHLDYIASGDLDRLMEHIRQEYSALERVMVVGHEPYLSMLVAAITTGSMNSFVELSPGSLCELAVNQIAFRHTGVLRSVLTPGQLRQLAT